MTKTFQAICGVTSKPVEKRVTSPVVSLSNAVVLPINHKLVDVFLNSNEKQNTGFEANCWLRLAKRGEVWVQVSGVRLPSWQYKKIVGELK